MAKKAKVMRLDAGAIRGGPQVTPQGFLRLDAAFGRVGVLRYQQPDGSVRRELRLPEEVFARDALESLEGAPIIRLHSEKWVTRETWRQRQDGFALGVRAEGNLVAGRAILQDEPTIQDTLAGKLHDFSPGYICLDMDEAPGVHELYGAYDAIQRGIVHNHIGFGPHGWGRQGGSVGVHLDGKSGPPVGVLRLDASPLGDFLKRRIALAGLTIRQVAEETGIIEQVKGDPLTFAGQSQTWILESILEGWTPSPTDAQLKALARVLDVTIDELTQLVSEGEQRLDGRDSRTHTRSKRMPGVEIKLDGLTVEVPARDAEIIRKGIEARDDQIAALTSGKSELQAKLDAANENLAKAKKDLDEAPAKLRAELAGRVELEGIAAKHGVKLDAKDSERQAKEKILAKLKPSLDLSGKDDAYVSARYDAAIEDAPAGNGGTINDGLRNAQRAAFSVPDPKNVRVDAADEDDPEVVRARNIEARKNGWRPSK